MPSGTSFLLPMPPSVNAIWRRSANSIHRSTKYKNWQKTAGKELQVQKVPKIKPPYKVEYEFGRPDHRYRDVFNFEKALSDLLEDHGVLTNDRLIWWGTVKWSNTVEPGKVRCTVLHLEDAELVKR